MNNFEAYTYTANLKGNALLQWHEREMKAWATNEMMKAAGMLAPAKPIAMETDAKVAAAVVDLRKGMEELTTNVEKFRAIRARLEDLKPTSSQEEISCCLSWAKCIKMIEAVKLKVIMEQQQNQKESEIPAAELDLIGRREYWTIPVDADLVQTGDTSELSKEVGLLRGGAGRDRVIAVLVGSKHERFSTETYFTSLRLRYGADDTFYCEISPNYMISNRTLSLDAPPAEQYQGDRLKPILVTADGRRTAVYDKVQSLIRGQELFHDRMYHKVTPSKL